MRPLDLRSPPQDRPEENECDERDPQTPNDIVRDTERKHQPPSLPPAAADYVER